MKRGWLQNIFWFDVWLCVWTVFYVLPWDFFSVWIFRFCVSSHVSGFFFAFILRFNWGHAILWTWEAWFLHSHVFCSFTCTDAFLICSCERFLMSIELFKIFGPGFALSGFLLFSGLLVLQRPVLGFRPRGYKRSALVESPCRCLRGLMILSLLSSSMNGCAASTLKSALVWPEDLALSGFGPVLMEITPYKTRLFCTNWGCIIY